MTWTCSICGNKYENSIIECPNDGFSYQDVVVKDILNYLKGTKIIKYEVSKDEVSCNNFCGIEHTVPTGKEILNVEYFRKNTP